MLISDFDGNGDLPVFWTVWVGGQVVDRQGLGQVPRAASDPPRPGGGTAMRLQGAAVAGGADVSTHHHFDWTEPFWGVRFWARATGDAPTELIVAITSLRAGPSDNYFAGLRAGRPWQARRVALTPGWQQHTIEFKDLAPEGAGEPVPLFGGDGFPGGAQLHLIVPEERAYDVWVDDVELGCRSAGCPGFVP